MNLLGLVARLIGLISALVNRVTQSSEPQPELGRMSQHDHAEATVVDHPDHLDEERCHLLLTETGMTIVGWPTRIAFVVLSVSTMGLLLFAAGFPIVEFSTPQRVGFALAGGLTYALLLVIIVPRVNVTETSAQGVWPFIARHVNRWMQLAGPRLFACVAALIGALIAIILGTRADIDPFDQAIWSNVAASLFVVAGAALIATLYEYRQRLRDLRWEAEPTILALQFGLRVDPHEVSKFLLSLARGVAGPRNKSIGLIDAGRVRVAIAIYFESQSPSAIAPIVNDAAVKLGMKRKHYERLHRKLAERQVDSGGPIERNSITSLAGHPRATTETWDLLFDWINEGSDQAAPLLNLRQSWSPPAR